MSKRRPRPETRPQENRPAASKSAAATSETPQAAPPSGLVARPAPKRASVVIALGIILLVWFSFLVFAALTT